MGGWVVVVDESIKQEKSSLTDLTRARESDRWWMCGALLMVNYYGSLASFLPPFSQDVRSGRLVFCVLATTQQTWPVNGKTGCTSRHCNTVFLVCELIDQHHDVVECQQTGMSEM
ncbi:unnamed protein product [Nippostrongylus brasiliensis]|uniref:C-type lectin domain-containing protein n=1 Tax=Nippostrongylus brasiliensis TaxID=27835 RepID=A0A0N4YEC8_NIPBR|nr:unnamed protein product [Nippostrongylus brasiliensis]